MLTSPASRPRLLVLLSTCLTLSVGFLLPASAAEPVAPWPGLAPAVATEGGTGGVSAILVGDLDLDGRADVLRWAGGLLEARSSGPDGALTPLGSTPSHAEPSALALGDVDGDGILDAVLGYSSTASDLAGEVAVRAGLGDGTFGAAVLSDSGRPVGSLATGDLDGDGFDDVAVDDGSRVALLLSVGNGALSPVATFPGAHGFPGGLMVGDVDGDGRGDLVVLEYGPRGSTSATLYRSQEDGTFADDRRAPRRLQRHVLDAARRRPRRPARCADDLPAGLSTT